MRPCSRTLTGSGRWTGRSTTSTAITLIAAGREYVKAYVEFAHFAEGLHITITRGGTHHEQAPEKEVEGHEHRKSGKAKDSGKPGFRFGQTGAQERPKS